MYNYLLWLLEIVEKLEIHDLIRSELTMRGSNMAPVGMLERRGGVCVQNSRGAWTPYVKTVYLAYERIGN